MAVARRVGTTTSKTRAVILDGTLQIMVDDGYAAVSSRNVAAKAGVKAPLIHYYFPTLEDLFIAALHRRSDKIVEKLTAALGCMLEAYRLARAMQISFTFDDPVRYVTDFAATIPDASPSMRLDHLARRRSEIDVINGQVVELSREHGLDAPYNETLCAVVRQREPRFD